MWDRVFDEQIEIRLANERMNKIMREVHTDRLAAMVAGRAESHRLLQIPGLLAYKLRSGHLALLPESADSQQVVPET